MLKIGTQIVYASILWPRSHILNKPKVPIQELNYLKLKFYVYLLWQHGSFGDLPKDEMTLESTMH